MNAPGRPRIQAGGLKLLAVIGIGILVVPQVQSQIQNQNQNQEHLLSSYLIPPPQTQQQPLPQVKPGLSILGLGNGPRQARSILQNFAVDRMLKDKGFVRSIINCVLDKGPCESNGRKLRLMAPEILRGQCPGCSRTVHQQIRRVISHVQRNFPVEWSEVTRRFMSMSSGGQDYGVPGSLSPPNPYSPGPGPDPNLGYQNVYG